MGSSEDRTDDSDRCIPEPLLMRYRSPFTSFSIIGRIKRPRQARRSPGGLFTRQEEREQVQMVTPRSGQSSRIGQPPMLPCRALCLSADDAGLGITGSPCGRPQTHPSQTCYSLDGSLDHAEAGKPPLDGLRSYRRDGTALPRIAEDGWMDGDARQEMRMDPWDGTGNNCSVPEWRESTLHGAAAGTRERRSGARMLGTSANTNCQSGCLPRPLVAL